MSMKFRGSFVALVTPFDAKGRLDRKTLASLVEWHIAQGTDGIVCCATTGESPALNEKERKAIAEICIQVAQGRIPVIVSTGVSDTKTSIRYTEMAQKIGAQGCLVVTPYYNKPSQQGCILHFSEVGKVGLPVVVYHNPPRAVVRLTLETILELSDLPHIVAIKESSHDLDLVRKIASKIDVLSGDDDLTFSILQAGGVGTISTVANIIPHGWKQMVSLCLQNKWEEGKFLTEKYLPLIKAIFLETNPQGTKFALSCLGKCHPQLRLPMVTPPLEVQNEIKKQLLRLALPEMSPFIFS